MERFGRPRFRGARAPKPFGARPGPSSRSNSGLGPSPRPSNNSFGNYQDSKSKPWSGRSDLSGKPPPGVASRNVQIRNNSYDSNSRASSGQSIRGGGNSSVPSEVHQLMQSFGLSQSDMQKLSQLPENELSVDNLAKAIGNLKKGKDFTSRGQPSSYNSSPRSESMQSDSFQHRPRNSFSPTKAREGILGEFPGSSRGRASRDDYDDPSNRHKPTGIKVTVKPSEQQFNKPRMLGPKPLNEFSGRQQFSNKGQRDEYYAEQQLYSRKESADRFDQPRHDRFSPSSRRVQGRDPHFNSREVDDKPPYHRFDNDRHVERVREPGQDRGSRGGLHRPVGTRNASKTVASSLPSLLDLPISPKNRGGGGYPDRSSREDSPGLQKLVAAVGRNSLLTPLMLASQTDPSVLEAQIRAMKALQAEAIKLRSEGRERERPMRRSPPPMSRAMAMERRMEDDARHEAHIMRQARGRVLYFKYKSPRIVEGDLRQLASVFGRVTKLLIIKPKIKNGHFQAFMEMHQSDCAAAMLERFMAKSPIIKNCPVDVHRSNYVDLQLKSDLLRGNKRLRSISPIRKGSTQVPNKRGRRSDSKMGLSITTSRLEQRRIVSKNAAGKKGQKQPKNSKQTAKKTDAREILNRSRSTSEKKGDLRKKLESDGAAEKTGDADKEANVEGDEAKNAEEKKEIKEEIDPLDALADELALHDEFVLMDAVGYDKEKRAREEKKAADLDGTDFDLDNVKVEIGQDDQEIDDAPIVDPDVEQEVEGVILEMLDIIDAEEHEEKLDAEKELLFMDSSSQQEEQEEGEARLEDMISAENEVQEYLYDESGNEEQEPVDEDPVVEDETPKLQTIISDSLKEVVEAKQHLDALVKVTKAKAAQSIAKKLRVCLEVAIAQLEGSESPA